MSQQRERPRGPPPRPRPRRRRRSHVGRGDGRCNARCPSARASTPRRSYGRGRRSSLRVCRCGCAPISRASVRCCCGRGGLRRRRSCSGACALALSPQPSALSPQPSALSPQPSAMALSPQPWAPAPPPPLSRRSRSSSCMGWIVLPRCCGGSGRAAGRQARRVITPPRQFTSPSHTPDRCRRRRRRCRCCAGRWWGCALSAPARCTSGRSAPQRCTPRRAADLRLPAAVSGPGRARGGRGRGSCFDSR
jgi:hypothetical protein